MTTSNLDKIIIKGAREHNLKGINLEIPKNRLVVFTGVSGSGKSSLAFDTIYAEGQRRYVESLSSYARQFLGVMDKPDVDHIGGLSPAISIDQKTTAHNPRSTVGTVTEIYDYLRLLFARTGIPCCVNCGKPVEKLTSDQILSEVVNKSLEYFPSSKTAKLLILAPLIRDKKGEYSKLFRNLEKDGYQMVRIDGRIYDLSDDIVLIKTNRHTIEVVIDRFVMPITNKLNEIKDATSRLKTSLEQGLKISDGEIVISFILDKTAEFPKQPTDVRDILFSQRLACPTCGLSIPQIEPRMFSFNTPHGACPKCTGLGYLLKVDESLVINEELTIAEGGILPIGSPEERETWYFRFIKAVAKQYNIPLDLPIKKIADEKMKIILYGTNELITVKGANRFGKITEFSDRFEGIIPRLERLYQETDSEWSRQNTEKYMRNETCPVCQGTRLKKEALSVTISGSNIFDVCSKPINEELSWVENVLDEATRSQKSTAVLAPICREIISRLKFLSNVGLDYLTLNRSANTLAGGEAQRIRLASQIGSGLSGVLYILDEPSIGLHQRDNKKLIETLTNLRDLGNSVIVVEHDREMMENSDLIVDFGPGAGESGGQILAVGTPEEIKLDRKSLTGDYLSERKAIDVKVKTDINDSSPFANFLPNRQITIVGATEHNLKNINVSFPIGKLTCITGVSGSGKSTLVHDILYHALATKLYPSHKVKPGAHKELLGYEFVDKVLLIDQAPIGRTPRSNPATYTGAFTPIRELFAATPDAKIKGFSSGKFSFNVPGGRCEACEGEGQTKIEMQFLPDVYVDCEVCRGKRYQLDILDIFYKDKNIDDILNMSVNDAVEFFAPIPTVYQKLSTLQDVGLGYIRLGQSAPTLSGGEAQRVKLSTELGKRATGKTVYILDEPTTGLHFDDLKKLLFVLKMLVQKGNTVIVIEHNIDVIKNADFIVDLGPEGGDSGGYVVAIGAPKEISQVANSWTGKYL